MHQSLHLDLFELVKLFFFFNLFKIKTIKLLALHQRYKLNIPPADHVPYYASFIV